ncbi:hypothetical protein PRIC2_001939 [Phytophthora ramorum]
MATKTVLITGSNRGIGLTFAQHYVKEGWNVVATARNVDAAEDLKQLNPWKVLTLDTGDEQSILSAAKTLEDVAVDLLINNSGISIGGGLDVTTKEDMLRQFEVNTVGPFLMTRAFLPNLRLAVAARGQAFVAQVTSRMGSIADNGSGGRYGYRASKAALNIVTQSLSLDLKSEKIGCLLLHPGFVNTAIVNFTGVVSPEDSVAGMARIIERAKLEDPLQMFHFEKGDALPWSDMATYSTGNAVTSFAAPNDFFNAAYDDLASTKEGERVLLAAWVVALVPLKPDVDPTVGSANWNRRSMTSDSEIAANVIDGGTVESPDGVTVKKMARDFRIRKFQEMTGLSYDELDAMTFSESADKFEAAAQASDKVSILQHLKVEYHAYYIAITDIIRKVSDPQDTCPSD